MFGVLPAQRHRVVLHAPAGRVQPARGPVFSGRHLVSYRGQRQLLLFESRVYARGECVLVFNMKSYANAGKRKPVKKKKNHTTRPIKCIFMTEKNVTSTRCLPVLGRIQCPPLRGRTRVKFSGGGVY